MSRARGEWVVARDQRSVESLRESDVSGVAGAHVVSQLPRASQQIYMGMTVQVEINKYPRLRRPPGWKRPHPFVRDVGDVGALRHPSGAAHDVRRRRKEAFFESYANWRLHGRQLFYRRRQQVLVVDVLETPRPTVSAPRPALESPCGRGGLRRRSCWRPLRHREACSASGAGQRVRVITNWWSVAAARDGAGKTAGLAQR